MAAATVQTRTIHVEDGCEVIIDGRRLTFAGPVVFDLEPRPGERIGVRYWRAGNQLHLTFDGGADQDNDQTT